MLDNYNSNLSFDIFIQIDESGAWGCRALFGTKWLQWQWPAAWVSFGIMAKNLRIPILLSCAVWAQHYPKDE